MGRASRNAKKAVAKDKEAAAYQAAEEAQLRGNLMNMRQMYEGVVQEKTAILGELEQLKLMVVALLNTKSKGKGTAVVSPKTAREVDRFKGVSVDKDPEGFVTLVALPKEIEGQLELEEDEDGQES